MIATMIASLAIGQANAQTPEPATPEAVKKTPATVRFTTCAKPVWPKEALRKEQTGTVTLSFLIDADGNVSDSKLVKSSGYELLDNAALEGIRKCRFNPALVDGKPVAVWQQMQYVWTLEKTESAPPEEKIAHQKAAEKDYAGAAVAFRAAAEKGSANAQFQLARMLLLGIGVDKDESQARDWLQKAAARDHLLSITALGQLMFLQGGRDEEACRMLDRAAKRNNPSAAYTLGQCYELGRGIARDIEQAKSWYALAAKGGVPQAKLAAERLATPSPSPAKAEQD